MGISVDSVEKPSEEGREPTKNLPNICRRVWKSSAGHIAAPSLLPQSSPGRIKDLKGDICGRAVYRTSLIVIAYRGWGGGSTDYPPPLRPKKTAKSLV